MFYRSYPILTAHARPEAVAAPKAPAALSDRLGSDIMRAMSRDMRSMSLSERLSDPAGYLRLQKARRESLESLLVAPPDNSVTARVIDLVCMITEESVWSENASLVPFDDEARPMIDFQCAETAMLLGWTRRAMGSRLDNISPRICARMLSEVRRRVFAPFLAHGDYPFMRGRGQKPLSIVCDIMLSAILLEPDGGRRTAVLKTGLRFLDQLTAAMDGRRVQLPGRIPLGDFACEVASVTDFVLLARRITRGEMDLTNEYPAPEWLDALLFAHMEGDFFADPAGMTLKPKLSGAEFFRIGLAANDSALAALGASMEKQRSIPSSTVTGRVLDLNGAGLMAAEDRKPPRLKYASAPRNALMCSRFSDLTFAIHTGGGKANAGDILVFAGNRPVIVGLPGYSSLPVIAGESQLNLPDAPCEADFRVKADSELMSVDLSRAYPASVPIQACQRTAMIMRASSMMRIVDAVELTSPAPIEFRFFVTDPPFMQEGVLRIGPVDFAWEGELEYSASETGPTPDFPGGLTCITLSTPEPVTQGYYTFALCMHN